MRYGVAALRPEFYCTAIDVQGRRPRAQPSGPHYEMSRQILKHEVALWRNASIATRLQAAGLATSGNKSDMLQTLQAGLLQKLQSPAPTCVLSIDMGVKNMAFAVLEVNNFGKRKFRPACTESFDATSLPSVMDLANMSAWNRLSVLEYFDTPEWDSFEKVQFNPGSVARLSYNIVERLMLPYKPSHILIERQRHRSASGSAVQEWTIRVNMLELMLHAVLHTMAREKPEQSPQVHSVDPKRVAQFFCGNEAQNWMQSTSDNINTGAQSTAQKKKPPSSKLSTHKIEKADKIRKVESWVRGTTNESPWLSCNGDAIATLDAFLAQTGGGLKKRQPKSSVSEAATPRKADGGIGKLDDLADCVLQGMAWLQWQANAVAMSQDLLIRTD